MLNVASPPSSRLVTGFRVWILSVTVPRGVPAAELTVTVALFFWPFRITGLATLMFVLVATESGYWQATLVMLGATVPAVGTRRTAAVAVARPALVIALVNI